MKWYQFVLSVEGDLPVTMKKRFRSKARAVDCMQRFKKEGRKGCLVTLFRTHDNYGMEEVEEF